MRQVEIVVQPGEKGERIDSFLAGKTGITRSQIQKLIESGDILVNEKAVSQHYRVKAQDTVSIGIAEKSTGELVPEPIPLDILYKDNYLVVVNKPAVRFQFRSRSIATFDPRMTDLFCDRVTFCGHEKSYGGKPGIL